MAIAMKGITPHKNTHAIETFIAVFCLLDSYYLRLFVFWNLLSRAFESCLDCGNLHI